MINKVLEYLAEKMVACQTMKQAEIIINEILEWVIDNLEKQREEINNLSKEEIQNLIDKYNNQTQN